MTLRHYFLMAALLLCGLSSTHAINRTELIKYAQTLKGKKGAELKKAMNPLLAPKTVLPYGSKDKGTWWGFWYTDRNPETNECYNRYSSNKFYFNGHTGMAISGMNIEHSFPKKRKQCLSRPIQPLSLRFQSQLIQKQLCNGRGD